MRTFGDLEASIMDVVWDEPQPVTVRQIVDRLEATKGVAYTTTITVVERLRAKGWLTRHREGRAFRYAATRSRSEYTARLMSDVLDASDDRSAALLSFAGQLDPRDAVSLRRALADLDQPERPES